MAGDMFLTACFVNCTIFSTLACPENVLRVVWLHSSRIRDPDQSCTANCFSQQSQLRIIIQGELDKPEGCSFYLSF